MDGIATLMPGGAAACSEPSSGVWLISWDLPGSRSSAAGDLAGLEARRAHVHALVVARGDPGVHDLHVRVPAAVGPTVRVRHRLPEPRALRAHVTDGSHGMNS